jgi:uncharacterized lipoprotein YddW (UPF0748 family)
MVFLSPGSQPAVKLMEDMLAELAANYDFDDIQLDRFRWTRKSAEGREFGYESDTAEAFRKKTGRVPPEDKNDTEWVVFREELVNQAVERCYRRIKAIRPEVVVSVAPVGYYGVAQSMQRWGPWLEGGYIDLVIPQIYITRRTWKRMRAYSRRNSGSICVLQARTAARSPADCARWKRTTRRVSNARFARRASAACLARASGCIMSIRKNCPQSAMNSTCSRSRGMCGKNPRSTRMCSRKITSTWRGIR